CASHSINIFNLFNPFNNFSQMVCIMNKNGNMDKSSFIAIRFAIHSYNVCFHFIDGLKNFIEQTAAIITGDFQIDEVLSLFVFLTLSFDIKETLFRFFRLDIRTVGAMNGYDSAFSNITDDLVTWNRVTTLRQPNEQIINALNSHAKILFRQFFIFDIAFYFFNEF